MNQSPGTIEEYIHSFPPEVKDILYRIRDIILQSHPDIEEKIAYGIPAYRLNKKPLVYFAAYPHHIGFYGTPGTHTEFKEKLAAYKQGKGSVQFPLNRDIPYELINEMVIFRIKENLTK
jgi:uncharacterized protein YdhG (YjbR/CyaY superfamily)